LPLHLYQIQTKFRDEIRPRFGVMRGREFTMKDGYSFHANYADLEREYRNMYETYTRIFTRLGLKFRAVAADTGSIGGTGSHEFHVLADSGEDTIAFCETSDYAANVELAPAINSSQRAPAAGTLQKVATPGKTKCEDVAQFLNVPLCQTVKAVAVVQDKEFVLLLVRGDHSLNEIKAEKLPGMNPFRFASDAEIVDNLGCKPGYIGPVGIPESIRIVADETVAKMSNFVCGANEAGYHLTGVNWGRDLPEPASVADIRNVVEGDASPDGKGTLSLCKGIEVGHIFQLRTNYSKPLQCSFLDETGKEQLMEMGCYGIGVTRIVGAAIEQGHDDRGIIFPTSIAPFEVSIVPVAYHKSDIVRAATDSIYKTLRESGIDVLLDDREERPGVLFADSDLVGIPHRVVIGERGLKEGKVEYKGRTDAEATLLPLDEILGLLKEKGCGASPH
jgi:prolyl-tRNA synthetase